ncbi:MAG: hypothetical protein JXB26_18560 [Candidatus Aminicenantes bacterium]|nr:hypothetical protein [Candidatus Aminicenantes bacterium]
MDVTSSKKTSHYFLVVSLVFLMAAFFPIKTNERHTNKQDLETILEKTAATCEKLMNYSLHFICEEDIQEEIFGMSLNDASIRGLFRRNETSIKRRLLQRNGYIYDYQLIRKNGKISEQRTLIEENGEEKEEKNAPIKTHIFTHRHVIFGPVGLLGKKAQENHQYKMVKETSWQGNQVFIVEASPKPNAEEEGLFGKIWIKKDDYSILRIEWNQESMGNYQNVLETARQLRAKPLITFSSDYGYEKNSIRFPSSYSVREEYLLKNGRKILRSLTTVDYKNYKFFVVETDVNFRH